MAAKGMTGEKSGRVGYRGYLLVHLMVEDVIAATYNPVTGKSLATKGYPTKFIWPEPDDFDGAKALVDAVLSRDAIAIGRFMARFPDVDFQLGDWWDQLRAEVVKEHRHQRTLLREREIRPGVHMGLEVLKDRDTGLRTLQAFFRRGTLRTGIKPLFREIAQ